MSGHHKGERPRFTLRREGVLCLCVVAAILAVYWQVGGHAFISYDDGLYITENRQVRAGLTPEGVGWAFTATRASNWHPLTWLSHMLDCQLYGLNPAGHHLTNVLFHLLNSILLFLILGRMTGAPWRSGLVAILFAVHPLHVESVAWAAERKDVLSALFWMLTMGAYLLYVERPGVGRYLAVVLLFALGLLSKPMVITLPFVFILLDYWPLGRLKIPGWAAGIGRLLIEKVPLFSLAAASGVVTFLVQRGGDSVASLEVLPIGARISNALVSYVAYLGKAVWPSGLAIFYPHPHMPPVWQIAGAAAILAGISLVAVWRVQRRPSLAVGWAWYLGTLVPAIGLVQVGAQAMADRYTYLPLIGIFIIVAWGLPDPGGGRRKVLCAAAAAALSALMVVAWMQTRHWKDDVTLFSHAIAVTDDNDVARDNLGNALLKVGQAEEAVELFREAVRINPRNENVHYNLGVALGKQGRREEAVEQFREVLRLDPGHARAHHNLGVAFADRGRPDEAIGHFRESLRLDPDCAEGHNGLAAVLADLGRPDEAIGHLREALRLDPGYAEAHNNLGAVLTGLGRGDEAVGHLREAVRIDPGYAEGHYNLGVALAGRGETDEAAGHLREAVRIDPGYARAHYNLGIVLADRGETDEAVGHLREAVRIDPGYAKAREGLDEILAHRDEVDEATRELREAIGRDPGNPALHATLALLYYRMGDLDGAADQYRRALSLDPDSVLIMHDLAAVCVRQGRDEEALALFERLSELRPDEAGNYYNSACLLARLGRGEEALIRLGRAVEKGYDDWDRIRTDRDLDGIRDLPGYRRLVEGR